MTAVHLGCGAPSPTVYHFSHLAFRSRLRLIFSGSDSTLLLVQIDADVSSYNTNSNLDVASSIIPFSIVLQASYLPVHFN